MPHGLLFLVQALVVVVTPSALLRVSRLRGFVPLVVVQIVVGIALGPSVFGRLSPDLYPVFVNPTSLASLSGIGEVAVLIFGLVTGLHVDPKIFHSNGRAFAITAAANIMVPAILGSFAGYWILLRHPEELLPGVSPVAFAVAVGICTAMTALPVLGEILREMNLLGSRTGHLALGIASINDVVLWVMLSILLTTVAAPGTGGPVVLLRFLLVPIYLVVMAWVVRPALGRMVLARMRDDVLTERALAIVAFVTIGSALATEAMGLHYVIGAFVTGVVMPQNLRQPILDRVQVMTVALLMPFFFIITGVRAHVDPTSSACLEVFLIATAVAVCGIFGGTAIAARCAGEPWPRALGLGALLQAKGLMELIVLTVLLDAGIISPNVFAALILMAVVCTAATMPLARLMLGRERSANVDRLAYPAPKQVIEEARRT